MNSAVTDASANLEHGDSGGIQSDSEQQPASTESRVAVDIYEENEAVYAIIIAWIAIFMMTSIWNLNEKYAPILHSDAYIDGISHNLAQQNNYAVFDLNIDIRKLRDSHIKYIDQAPDVALLGASHWQEAPATIIKHKHFYNAHVHRDYYEDMLSVVHMFERHGKLPKQLIITLRDRLFTPVPERTDALWFQTIPYYRPMAARLGLEQHSHYETLPGDSWREKLSLSLLATNLLRFHSAPELPHASGETQFETLDTLLPGGSINWSNEHRRIFTAERARDEALSFAQKSAQNPPQLDRKGVIAIDRLIEHLTNRGVEVFLAHPPFNPYFWDAVQGTPYMAGLRRVAAMAEAYAQKYGLHIVGSFNPYDLGCTKDMYIDAEHSGEECIGRILLEYADIDQRRQETSETKATTSQLLNIPGLVSDPYEVRDAR